MTPLSAHAASGTLFKFTVKSADEAAVVIRERLGPGARVLSVRNVPADGLSGLWSAPRLEVIAQLAAVEPAPSPVPAAVSEALSPEMRNARGRDKRSLAELLRLSGLSPRAVQRLQLSADWPALNAAPLHRGLVETGRFLRQEVESRTPSAPLTRAAFLGTAGTGRTTALCKWLSSEVFRRARIGHVVTAEFDRPNATGPLPVFCEALGVPLAHYPASTQPATPGGFVYFDVPSLSLRDPADNAALTAFLDRERIEQRVLVLNAAYDATALRAAYAAGRMLGATHVIFTHLDEVTQWGRLWEFLWDSGLEPLFLSTGPSLSGDCEEQVLDTLVRRTLPAADESAAADDASGPVSLSTAA
jgi:flagellar biosynthesis protein FlhF